MEFLAYNPIWILILSSLCTRTIMVSLLTWPINLRRWNLEKGLMASMNCTPTIIFILEVWYTSNRNIIGGYVFSGHINIYWSKFMKCWHGKTVDRFTGIYKTLIWQNMIKLLIFTELYKIIFLNQSREAAYNLPGL